MIRVLIADDHAVVRRGLAQIINDESDMVLAAEASDAAEAERLAASEEIDVAVIDITMPGTSGVELIKELRGRWSTLPVLVLSIHPEEQYAVRCLRAGASGYLTKDAAPDKLVEAIRTVTGGHKFITPGVAERLARLVESAAGDEPHQGLSDREFEVARLIASGMSGREMAETLNLSVKTVSTYRSRILEKMGMHTNTEITRYVIERDLL
jgi:two-component system invasion response regulator UvrY